MGQLRERLSLHIHSRTLHLPGRRLPSLEALQDHFFYDPRSGELKYRINGELAGCISHDGERVINIRGRLMRASHIIWAMLTGDWPQRDYEVRPVDGRASNTRRDNLILVYTKH